MRKANHWIVAAAARQDRLNQMYWQGIEQSGDCRRGIGALREKCLYRVRRSQANRMDRQNSARVEETEIESARGGVRRQILAPGLIKLRAGRIRNPHRQNPGIAGRRTEKAEADLSSPLAVFRVQLVRFADPNRAPGKDAVYD